jgi:enamine deaminase RidA (YjgF/YER057c/UK114 family)
MKQLIIGAVASALLVTSSPQAQVRRHIILDNSSQRAHIPISDAVLVGDTLYLSGYVGVDPKSAKVPDSTRVETRLAMEGLQQALAAVGMTMDDLVKVDVLCTDLSRFDAFDTVYSTYFKSGFPARTFTGANNLLFGAHFELTGVAVRHRPHASR